IFRKECEDEFTDVYVSLDGEIVPAREWIDRPEVLAIADYSEDQYRGHGEYDPEHPSRCWFGQALPSGRMARVSPASFDSVDDMARKVVEREFKRAGIEPGEYLVMLPGGEYVDAHDWAHRPETRRIAGSNVARNRVRYRATATCATCDATITAVTTR